MEAYVTSSFTTYNTNGFITCGKNELTPLDTVLGSAIFPRLFNNYKCLPGVIEANETADAPLNFDLPDVNQSIVYDIRKY